MARTLRPFTRLIPALLLGVALALPLRAQLDPRLQGSATDFLDLYTQSINLVMKPEVVTVFDFSGSMAQIMPHPNYPSGGDEPNAGMSFTLTGPGNGTTTYKDKYGTTLPSGRYDVTVALNSGISLTKGSLVRPDGTLLEYKTNGDTAINTNYVISSPLLGGENAATKASDVRNWIRCASHARFTYGGKTFDLPLCWTILDATTTVDTTNANVNLRQFRKSYNTSYPLKMTIINPSTSSNTEIEMDTAYRVMTNDTGAYGMFSSTTGTSPMTACTFRNGNNVTGNFVGWGQGYLTWIFTTSTTIPQATTAAGYAFANGIPGRTRTQAIKDAAMRSWVKYYNKVFWAYRFLKYFGTADATTSAETESANQPSNDSRHDSTVDDPTTKPVFGESQRAWVLLNDSSGGSTLRSDAGLKRLAAMVASGYTPLNSALANTYAQLNDPNCVFNDIETGTDKPVECRNTYVILFTDGQPNLDAGTPTSVSTPYITTTLSSGTATTASGTANAGNTFFAGSKTQIDTPSSYYNIINLAAVAAHGGETTNGGFTPPTYPSSTETFSSSSTTGQLTSAWIPFWIRQRGTGTTLTTFVNPHSITTMTVGVAMGDPALLTTGATYRLFAAAACGDPTVKTWDLTQLTPFTLVNPADPTQGKTPNSTYFFNATNPALLATSLDAAFFNLTNQSNINSTSNPNLPFIGTSIGKQIYLGKFLPPANGGVLWSGDLLTFPTMANSSAQTVILDKNGNPTTTLDATTAVWSAATALANNRRWDSRKLYTRIPGQSSLTSFNYTGPTYTNSTIATPPGLMNYVATDQPSAYPPGGTAQQALIELVMGANLGDPLNATNSIANRSNIMGDIIDSSPAYLEYNFSEVTANSSFSSTKLQGSGRNRFRIILVGDNQGWLHAFGETSQINAVHPTSAPTTTVNLVTGEVDELWAFMPTDFLANLDYLNQSTNRHPFMVDGSPTIYFLDLPTSASTSVGNGVLDGSNVTINPLTDTTHERAIAIIGLRKGGRSYYAINLHNPFSPTLQWSLVPDEAASLSSSRNKTGLPDTTLRGIVANMGYSTSTPSIGRVLYGGVYTDVVFFGGGYSVPEIEVQFSGSPKLGRSILAVEVNTGNILAAVDLTSGSIGGTSIGPISAGVVPFEFFLGSGMAQRAYFLDMWGGLWCWGSKQVVSNATSSYNQFRIDTSELTNWTSSGSADAAVANSGVRKVYDDANSTATAITIGSVTTTTLSGPAYSTLPAPFLVGTFPGKGHTSGSTTTAIPATVGIAMVSGNRNDPLDYGTNQPANTRLTVVFDRQDSRAWNLDTASGPDAGINSDAQLLNAGKWSANGVDYSTLAYGATSILPGSTGYYLAPSSQSSTQFGYYVTFPDKQVDPSNSAIFHYSKGINSPVVVAGSAYYSYFTPTTANVCTGGSGFTYSNMICDVLNPVVSDVRTGLSCTSGEVFQWVNVASDYAILGVPGVQQAGTLAKANPSNPSQQVTYLTTNTFLGQGSSRYPKPRVWRTVH